MNILKRWFPGYVASQEAMARQRARYPDLFMTRAEIRARCLAAGEICKNSTEGCTCHKLSAYQPTLAPGQPPLLTGPADLGEWHDAPKEPCWVCAATWCAALVSAGFVIAAAIHFWPK